MGSRKVNGDQRTGVPSKDTVSKMTAFMSHAKCKTMNKIYFKKMQSKPLPIKVNPLNPSFKEILLSLPWLFLMNLHSSLKGQYLGDLSCPRSQKAFLWPQQGICPSYTLTFTATFSLQTGTCKLTSQQPAPECKDCSFFLTPESSLCRTLLPPPTFAE